MLMFITQQLLQVRIERRGGRGKMFWEPSWKCKYKKHNPTQQTNHRVCGLRHVFKRRLDAEVQTKLVPLILDLCCNPILSDPWPLLSPAPCSNMPSEGFQVTLRCWCWPAWLIFGSVVEKHDKPECVFVLFGLSVSLTAALSPCCCLLDRSL